MRVEDDLFSFIIKMPTMHRLNLSCDPALRSISVELSLATGGTEDMFRHACYCGWTKFCTT